MRVGDKERAENRINIVSGDLGITGFPEKKQLLDDPRNKLAARGNNVAVFV